MLLLFLVGCQPVTTAVPSLATPVSLFPSATLPPLPTQPPAPTTTATLQPATATPDTLAEHLATHMDNLAVRGAFTGSVLVAREGQILLSQGYGFADHAQQIPNSAETRFRICSITKQFTAMAILMLQQRGALDVHDTVCSYLDPCPSTWQAITIHHLLVHTSGIPDFVDLPDYESFKGLPTTPLELIARFRDLPLLFSPGDTWSYSNSGYIVLGYIIERVSGQTYADFIQDNIFTPLHMEDSGYDPAETTIAIGYLDRWDVAGYIDASVAYAAGALYSTVEDMYRWDQALYTEQLLPQDLLDDLFAPYADTPIGSYGYGWFTSREYNQQVISHGGGGDGFITLIKRFPRDQVTLILLSNRESTDIGAIADALAGMVFGE